MTEIELFSTKLIEAMQDKNPVLLLRRIKNNANTAIALADANSILTEAAKYKTTLAVTNRVLTTASESKHVERLLSYMCLQKLSELYRNTYAYKNGFIDEQCKVIKQIDTTCKTRLNNISKYLAENVVPLIHSLSLVTSRMSKQHILRKMLTTLDKIG